MSLRVGATAGLPFDVLLTGQQPGLTLTVEVYDPTDGATILSPDGAGITEPRPGSYRAQRTVLVTGSFMIRWTDTITGAVLFEQELQVDAAQASLAATGTDLLASVVELRSYLRAGEDGGLGVAGSRELDNTFLEMLLRSASTRAERYTGRRFSPDPADDQPVVARTIAPVFARGIAIPDARYIEQVTADGTILDPSEYRTIGAPATILRVDCYPKSVTITGRFGFATVPDDVRSAVLMMAARAFHDAQARLGDRVSDPDGGVVSYFRQLPVEAKGILDSYRRGQVLA